MVIGSEGKIKDQKGFTQKVIWPGLKFGSASPTDGDLFLEIQNKLFLFGEVKHQKARFGGGQELCFLRLVEALESAGKTAVYLRITHSTPPPDPVDISNSPVPRFYFQNQWFEDGRPVKEVIQDFLVLAQVDEKYLG